MKKVLFILSIATAGLIVLNTNVKQGHTNDSGSPNGYTGSPNDFGGRTCNTAGCHVGNATTTQAGLITSNIPLSGYVPGSTYTIAAKIADADSNAVKFGFQLSPQKSDASLAGTMTVLNDTRTKLMGGNKYFTHKLAGTGNAGLHNNVWTVDWTAPAAGTGDVTFYGAFNITNNNSSASGDKVFTSSLTVSEGTVGVKEDAALAGITLFPNPNNGNFKLMVGANATIKANVFSTDGKLVYSNSFETAAKQNISLGLADKLSAGIYMLVIEANGSQKAMKFVVQ